MSQLFKSIYFPSSLLGKKGRAVTISFSEKDAELLKIASQKTNNELRSIIGISYIEDIIEKSKQASRTISQFVKLQLQNNVDKIIPGDVTFKTSKSIPFQRWFQYAEGYSTEFVENIITSFFSDSTSIYEPFAGTGSTIYGCNNKNINCYYSEVNPLMIYIIKTKIQIHNLTSEKKNNLYKLTISTIDNFKSILEDTSIDDELLTSYTEAFENSEYFNKDTLTIILKLRTYIDLVSQSDVLLASVITLAVLSSLLKVSNLKKVGDVRFKTQKEKDKELINPIAVITTALFNMAEDIKNDSTSINITAEHLLYNTKLIDKVNDLIFDGVITSPPYLNGTNYIRNTKIELWFLRYIKTKKDLRKLRNDIITSGINDVLLGKPTGEARNLSSLLDETLNNLNKNAYDKRIPVMANQYFDDMLTLFNGLRSHLSTNSTLAIDIGDSIFGGVHIKTDKILMEMLQSLGYTFENTYVLRERRSKNGEIIKQVLLIFKYKIKTEQKKTITQYEWTKKWGQFKNDIPYQKEPYSKRNWGNQLHSLCSYQGKLKPSIAHFLVNTFVPLQGKLLDPFSGVGTIPFEGKLNNNTSYAFDISLPAYYISSAKVGKLSREMIQNKIDLLDSFIKSSTLSIDEIHSYDNFGFNKKISTYYEKNTYIEILKARKYFNIVKPSDPNDMFIISALLHILHGNRPYALSRRSHPIVPYAPTGEEIYKNLIEHLSTKVNKDLDFYVDNNYTGKVYLQDATDYWPAEIDQLDAIITSPPFFDSTRFYLANWIRLWFCGWNDSDFKKMPSKFVDERQKISFSVYDSIFLQARERLKNNGVFVLHLGKSYKCDMAEMLIDTSKKWFKKYDLFTEDVAHCESHGIRDKGTVEKHQFLILT